TTLWRTKTSWRAAAPRGRTPPGDRRRELGWHARRAWLSTPTGQGPPRESSHERTDLAGHETHEALGVGVVRGWLEDNRVGAGVRPPLHSFRDRPRVAGDPDV